MENIAGEQRLAFQQLFPYKYYSFQSSDCHKISFFKGAVSRNSAKLGNYKMPVKLRET